MAIEIVSFPMKNGDFPWFVVCLPEGIHQKIAGDCTWHPPEGGEPAPSVHLTRPGFCWDWGMHRINSYVFSGHVGQYGIYKTHMSHTYNTYNLYVYIYNLDLQTSKYFCTYVPLG